MSSKVISYTVNSQDRISEVNSAWDEFAEDNDGHSIHSLDVLGTELQSCYADSETASFYDQILQQVRVTGDPTSIPFRCDSPSLKRFLKLSIYPKENGWLRLVSSPIRVQSRVADLNLLDARAVDPTQNVITMCSICKSVQVHKTLWLDIDSAVKILHLGAKSPPSQQTICPNCAKSMTECRHLLASPVRSNLTPLPLVVVLRRLVDYWIPQQQPSTLPLRHPYHVLSPFMWEYEPDPTDYILGRMEFVLEQQGISKSTIYLVAYESASDIFWKLLKNADSLFAAGLVVNPSNSRPADLKIECPVGIVSESGAIVGEPNELIADTSQAGYARSFTTYQSFHGSLYHTLEDPAVGGWLFDCLKTV
jgi:hypothetical protein